MPGTGKIAAAHTPRFAAANLVIGKNCTPVIWELRLQRVEAAHVGFPFIEPYLEASAHKFRVKIEFDVFGNWVEYGFMLLKFIGFSQENFQSMSYIDI